MSKKLLRFLAGCVVVVALLGSALGGRVAHAAGSESTRPAAAKAEKNDGWQYDTDYIYAMTRGVHGSDVHSGIKMPITPVTLVLDTSLLPVARIWGSSIDRTAMRTTDACPLRALGCSTSVTNDLSHGLPGPVDPPLIGFDRLEEG